MNSCPNCKSENFALIVRGMKIEDIIEELVKLNKIYLDEPSDDPQKNDDARWICNVCLTRWGNR